MATMSDERIPVDTDVVLLIGNKRFYCNRHRLAQKSTYFDAMFKSRMIESEAQVIELKEVNALPVKTLIDFANTSVVPNVAENVQQLLEVASMYQFDVIVEKCVGYIKLNCSIQNCLGVMFLGDRLCLSTLFLYAKQIALWNFDAIVGESEFLNLPFDAVIDYLSHDDLNVTSEFVVFKGIMNWVTYYLGTTSLCQMCDKCLMALITVVRFSAMELRDLKSVAHEPLVQTSPQLRSIIHEIWKMKYEDYRNKLSLRGVSTDSITPLSDISPAESLQSVNADPAEDLVVEGSDCVRQSDEYANERPLNRIDAARAHLCNEDGETNNLPSKGTSCAIKVERVFALRLLTVGPRHVPTFPAVVLYNQDEKSIPPFLICYGCDEQPLLELGEMKKAFQNTHVALGFKACAVGNIVYIVGGEFMFGHSNWNTSVWGFNTFTKNWTFVVNLRSPRRHHAICVMRNCLYVIGGTGRFRMVLDSVEKVDLSSYNWSDVAPLPVAVHSAACAVYQGRIYVMETCVYCYDANVDTWLCLRAVRLPHEIGFHTAMPHTRGIYLVGRNSRELIRYVPDGSSVYGIPQSGVGERKSYEVVGRFSYPTENACIVGDKIYTFSNTDFLIIESYCMESDTFAVEFESKDRTYRGASYSHGCFCLPKYS